MSQRNSGYVRQNMDLYETPEWVTEALIPHLPNWISKVWEPACGSRKMVRVLKKNFKVRATDITTGHDLMSQKWKSEDAIITNPPFDKSREFIERSLDLAPLTAMLLRTDYDHAKTRQHLFGACPSFARKVVLTKRIVWFDRPGAAPSFNHAWFIWDHTRDAGPPTIGYA